MRLVKFENFQSDPLSTMDLINGFLSLERQFGVEKWYDTNTKEAKKKLKYDTLPKICQDLERLLESL